MSNNLSFSMSLDDSDFSQKAQNAKQSLNEMGESVKKNNTFMREYMREIKNLKSQLLQLEEGTEDYTKAMQQLADKTFALRDIQETAKLSANDLGERFVLMSKTLGGITQGYGAVLGVMNLFGIENEHLNNVLIKFQSVIAIVNGLQGLEGLTKTIPACINMFKGLTAQSKLCALAMKSIPYVAIGSAIVGLIGYITKQTKATKELTEEQKKAEAEAKRLQDVEKTKQIVEQNTIKNVGEMMGKYKLLQTQWNLLGNDLKAKEQFIKDNAKAFNDLGIQVDTVAQAEKILVNDTDNFCKAMKLRAQAIALQNQIVEESDKYFKQYNQKGVKYGTHYNTAKEGDYFANEEEAKAAGKNYKSLQFDEYTNGQSMQVNIMTAEDAMKVNAYRNKEALQINKDYKAKVEADYTAKMNELTSQLQSVYKEQNKISYGNLTPKSNIPIYNNNGGGGGSKNNNKTTNNTTTTNNEENQQIDLTELLKQSLIVNGGSLSAYNAEYEKQTGNELNSRNYWDDLTRNLQNIADASGSEEFVKKIETLITTLPNYEAPKKEEEKVEVNVLQLAQDAVNSGNFTVLDEYIKTQTQAQQGSVRFLEAKINALQDIESNTDDMELIGKVDTEVDKLKKELEQLKQQIRAKTDPEGVKIETQQNFYKQGTQQINDLKQATSGVAQIFSSIASMTDDATGAWLNYVGGIISTAGQLISTLQAISLAQAISGATSLGPLGIIQIAVSTAAVLAAFASLPKFENGGIVGGNSYTGDKLLIRANSSEMVLSTIQQRNLFSLLNNGGTLHNNNGGVVHFKIQGKELVGVLRNYNNKVSKVL